MDQSVVNLPPGAVARLDASVGRLNKILGGGDGPGWLEAWVSNDVRPGAPLALSWRLHAPLGRATLPDIGTHLHLDLALLDGADVLGPLGTFTVGTATGARTVVPRGAPELLRQLYTVGTSVIQVRLTGDGAAPGPYLAEVAITISPEDVGSSWWQWTLAGGVQQVWRSQYQLVGRFVNRSSFSDLTVTMTLAEVPDDGGAPTTFDHAPVSAPHRRAMPMADAGVVVAFPPMIKDWTWILDGVCLYTGPVERWFGYTLSLTLTDQFRNEYRTTAGVNIHVVVPDVKQVAGLHATQLMAAAAVFLVLAIAAALGYFTAVGAPFLFGTASALQVAAQLVCTAAKDPPEPDFAFLEPVLAERPGLPPEDGTATNLWQRLGVLSTRIYGINLALSATQGKLEGARLAGDLDGIRIQSTSYLKMVADLREDASSLAAVHAAAPAASELLTMPDDLFVKVAMIIGQGPTTDMSDAWSKAGGDAKGLRATIDRVTAQGGPADGGKCDLAGMLPDLAAAATDSILQMLSEAPKIVAGSPQLPALIDDSIGPLEATVDAAQTEPAKRTLDE